MVRKTRDAFLWFTKILKKNKIPFEIGGSFASIIYGPNRLLEDVNLELNSKSYNKLFSELKKNIVSSPKIYKSKDWAVEILSLNHEGQKIDLIGISYKKLLSSKKQWISLGSQKTKQHLKKVYGIKLSSVKA